MLIRCIYIKYLGAKWLLLILWMTYIKWRGYKKAYDNQKSIRWVDLVIVYFIENLNKGFFVRCVLSEILLFI